MISDKTRESIKKTQARREYDRLLGGIEALAKQHGGNVDEAIEFYIQQKYTAHKAEPTKVERERLDQISRELKVHVAK